MATGLIHFIVQIEDVEWRIKSILNCEHVSMILDQSKSILHDGQRGVKRRKENQDSGFSRSV